VALVGGGMLLTDGGAQACSLAAVGVLILLGLGLLALHAWLYTAFLRT
jgi:hypothetical protein